MTADREEALMREMLAAVEPPSPGLADRVLAAVAERPNEGREPGAHWTLSLVAAALAAALVVTLALGVRPIRQASVPAMPGAAEAAVPVPGAGARLFLTSAADGWMAEQSGGTGGPRTTLYRTVDGGRTWSARLVYDGGLPTQVVVDPSGTGVVVAGQRDEAAADLVLYRTGDGGATWGRAVVPDGVAAWGVPYFVDGAHGWVLASQGPGRAAMLSTADGALTWSASPTFNDRTNFPGISSIRLRILWAGGGRALVVPPLGAGSAPVHVLVSDDGGASWRSSFPATTGQQVTGAYGLLVARVLADGRAVLFLQPVDGRGQGTGLFAYVSADAGRSWSRPVRVDGPATSRVLFALDEGHWWASSGRGADLVTTA
ncbi:MAG TPA: sialidase family protein, partial [Candidatus Eisenbacteria bacterium]|nr:sialidase family protein [Candidatus Eisenbacteria bacterium]